MLPSRPRLFFAIVGSLATLGTAAIAQEPTRVQAKITAAVEKVQKACEADVRQYCGSVTPGEGRLIMCMQAHEDKVSAQCDFALFEASRNLQRALDRVELVADSCWPDIEKLCANVAPAGGRVAQCLQDNKAKLSKLCQRVIK